MLEQVGSALIAHARDFIQCGAAHLFAAQLAVILDGEPVDLLLHPAHQRKQRRTLLDAQLPALRRHQRTGAVAVVLHHAQNGDMDAHGLQLLLRGLGLQMTAVHQQQVRQRGEVLVPVQIPLHPPLQHLL